MSNHPPLNKSNFQDFYRNIYPVDDVVSWLSYNLSTAEDTEEETRQRSHKSADYIANREFCFTLVGDIFTRFRSYDSKEKLKKELVQLGPEKIDVGAVYDMPAEKKKITTITPKERELVFDIDMSDYDHVRSCCKGKSICEHCWGWMACAAKVLSFTLQNDFGFKYLLPVFSGRRGVHLWVCDRRARKLSDEARGAMVGYMSVFLGENKTACGGDLAKGLPIHPTLQHISKSFLGAAFESIFLSTDSQNKNSIRHYVQPALVVYQAIVSTLKEGWRNKEAERLVSPLTALDGGATFEGGDLTGDERINPKWWESTLANLTSMKVLGALAGAQFLLLYPRLDIHVSTRKDHLLKLPFCIHPGTGSLCCPLFLEAIDSFNPKADPPTIYEMLSPQFGNGGEGYVLDPKWKRPLSTMLSNMAEDPEERDQADE